MYQRTYNKILSFEKRKSIIIHRIMLYNTQAQIAMSTCCIKFNSIPCKSHINNNTLRVSHLLL